MEGPSRRRGSTLVGAGLVLLGGLLLLDNLGVIDLGGAVRRFWPLVLVAVGVLQIARSRELRPGWFPVVLGGVLLLATLGVVTWRELWRLWPVVLVLIGLRVLLGRRTSGRRASRSTSDEDVIALDVLFSGVERRVTSRSFRGGKIDVVFGGAEIDLTEAAMAAEGGVLEVSAVFGGVELRLPRDFDVDVQPSAVLGGVNERLSRSEPSGGRLAIKASAVLGGIEIRN